VHRKGPCPTTGRTQACPHLTLPLATSAMNSLLCFISAAHCSESCGVIGAQCFPSRSSTSCGPTLYAFAASLA
jgi:hypothetical protein